MWAPKHAFVCSRSCLVCILCANPGWGGHCFRQYTPSLRGARQPYWERFSSNTEIGRQSRSVSFIQNSGNSWQFWHHTPITAGDQAVHDEDELPEHGQQLLTCLPVQLHDAGAQPLIHIIAGGLLEALPQHLWQMACYMPSICPSTAPVPSICLAYAGHMLGMAYACCRRRSKHVAVGVTSMWPGVHAFREPSGIRG